VVGALPSRASSWARSSVSFSGMDSPFEARCGPIELYTNAAAHDD
jgi:hypothetical protein